jgi:hypothetical protein
LSFVAAALLIAAFVPAAAPPEQPAGARRLTARGYLADIGEGLRFIRHDRLLLAIAGMVAVTNLLDQGLFAVLIPVWVRSNLDSAEPSA